MTRRQRVLGRLGYSLAQWFLTVSCWRFVGISPSNIENVQKNLDSHRNTAWNRPSLILQTCSVFLEVLSESSDTLVDESVAFRDTSQSADDDSDDTHGSSPLPPHTAPTHSVLTGVCVRVLIMSVLISEMSGSKINPDDGTSLTLWARIWFLTVMQNASFPLKVGLRQEQTLCLMVYNTERDVIQEVETVNTDLSCHSCDLVS